MSGSFIKYEDFKSMGALGSFVGTLPNNALINIETIEDQIPFGPTPTNAEVISMRSEPRTFRVWYYNLKRTQ
jgi:hypothetical protein